MKTFYWVFIFLFLLLGCGACSTNRHRQFSNRGAVKVASSHSDSIQQVLRNRISADQKIKIRHIMFDAPDSVGRQSITGITEVTVEEQSRQESVTTTTGGSVTQSQADIFKESEDIMVSQESIGKKWIRKAGLICFICVCAGLFVYLKKRL